MHLNYQQLREVVMEKLPDGLIVPEHTADTHFYRHTGVDEKYASVTTKSGILDAPYLKTWAVKVAMNHIRDNLHLINMATEEDIFSEAMNKHKEIFEDAGDVGTRGHDTIDRYLRDWMKQGFQPDSILEYIEVGETDPRVTAIARSAEMFCNDYLIEPIASEIMVASPTYKFGGTVDSLMSVAMPVVAGRKGCEHDFYPTGRKEDRTMVCPKCSRVIKRVFAIVDWKTSNSIDKVEYAMQVSAYWKAIEELIGINPEEAFIVQISKKEAKYTVARLVDHESAFEGFMVAGQMYDWLHDTTPKLDFSEGDKRITKI